MISNNKKFIFVHIPKSGGTSVNSALKEYCEFPPELSPGVRNNDLPSIAYKKHTNIFDMKKEGIDIDQYFKFCIIRNPWDRILSLYFHRIQLISRTIDLQEKTFNSWIRRVFLDEKTKRYWVNQVDYISIDGKLVMDHMIRFENLQFEWTDICKKLNIQKELPHEYKTDHKQSHIYYNKKSKEIIHEMFIRDIEMLDYRFC